jgi:hypothetical protein
MAYAAITSGLKQEVRSKIQQLKNVEIITLKDHDHVEEQITSSPLIQEALLTLMWESTEPDLRDRLEKYNRDCVVKFKFTMPAEYSHNGTEERVKECRATASKGIPCLVEISTGYNQSTAKTYSVDFHSDPLFAEYADAFKNRRECSKRWEAVETQVLNFLDSCKSVNEALKLWPDVARYLPKHAIDKVNLKAEKQVKEVSDALKALGAIDMDAVNTSTVLARMAGARI